MDTDRHNDGAPLEGHRVSRRAFITTAGIAVGAAALTPSVFGALGPGPVERNPPSASPAAALRTLLQGNKRYRRGDLQLRDYSPVGDRVAEAQAPFAAIITCSDSRISPTLVFDIGRGNMFVSRIAGNTIDTGTLGSTEYAVAVLGVKLVMVLGHTDCGAVKAALGVANGTSSFPPEKYGSIGPVIDDIVPAVTALPSEERTLERAIAANVIAQAKALAATDPIVKPAVDGGALGVVAAVYDIPTGRVRVL